VEVGDGSWCVTSESQVSVEAPDLETALLLFVRRYDRSHVNIGPMSATSDWGEEQDDEDTVVIDL
jgi:hypothetical protein